MRPGQQAPESQYDLDNWTRNRPAASMRPGQQAPESRHAGLGATGIWRCFNEARAASPGIPSAHRNLRWPLCGCFNEAKAASPGIPGYSSIAWSSALGCFNEARAASPGIPALGHDFITEISGASMRPGQQAPESPTHPTEYNRNGACFNEARAASPGIPMYGGGSPTSDCQLQ